MVYSGIFSGTAVTIAFFYAMSSSLLVTDHSIDLFDSSNEILDLENKILESKIRINSITATGNSQIVDVTLENVGDAQLSNYEKFTIIATYDADIGGVKTRVTETFLYDEDDSHLISSNSVQYARPNSDISSGTWDDTIGGDSDSDLYDEVNESTRSDANYASSSSLTVLGQTDVWEVGLSTVSDPFNDNNHVVRYVYRTDPGLGIDMDLHVSLLEGASTIASWSHSNIGTTFTQANNTLTTTQASTITDYSQLSLEFTAEYSGGLLPGKSGHVSWAELEVPNSECATYLSTGEWLIKNIDDDNVYPTLLNSDEVANICLKLSNSLYGDGILILVISSDHGVTSSRSTSWP